MGVFFYYLPGRQAGSVTREELAATPLAATLRDCLETQRDFQNRIVQNQVLAQGPDGFSGVLLFAQPARLAPLAQRVGYYAADQIWHERAGYWIGWDRGCPPDPASLARESLTAGVEEILGDGHVWCCPLIRRLGRAPNLPRVMEVDAAGEFGMRVLPAYDWAWELSGEIFNRVFGEPTYPFADAFRLAVGALSLNYRVGPDEASLLGLITTLNFQKVFEAAIDWRKLEELLGELDPADPRKKKEASPPPPANTTPGRPDGSPITRPAAATSS